LDNAGFLVFLPDAPNEETTMTMIHALFGIILVSLVTPALAANVEFYVVQNIASGKCLIKE
jgi:hypothetical protein